MKSQESRFYLYRAVTLRRPPGGNGLQPATIVVSATRHSSLRNAAKHLVTAIRRDRPDRAFICRVDDESVAWAADSILRPGTVKPHNSARSIPPETWAAVHQHIRNESKSPA